MWLKLFKDSLKTWQEKMPPVISDTKLSHLICDLPINKQTDGKFFKAVNCRLKTKYKGEMI